MLSVSAYIDAPPDELVLALTEIATQRGLDQPVERASDTREEFLGQSSAQRTRS